ncbi:hypothetical protein V491_06096 [Pseudogymnoascus sp. VKM F-3775]|nr:hypothetical protein V491_06096 [Pseudogymnoascus sp. VKM F-3775]
MSHPASGSEYASGSEPRSGSESGPGSEASSGSGPYQTSLEDPFISPLTPFLNHISFVEHGAPIDRWCEHRLIYYSLCTHIINTSRCNNPDNPTGMCLPGPCRVPDEYITYAERLCPHCQPCGHPEPVPTEDEFARRNSEWRVRANMSRNRFFQLVSDSLQDGNLALQEIEDPDEVLRNPNILGEEILAEIAACAVDDARNVFFDDEEEDEEEEDEEGSSEFEDPMGFEPEEPQPDQSKNWVSRLPQENSPLTREQWYARLAWRYAAGNEMFTPATEIGVYYVPNDPSDNTGLLLRPNQPIPSEETCAVCMEATDGNSKDSEVRQLPCGHLFHYGCILRWLYYRNCPVCRRVYVLKRLPLFLDEEGHPDENENLGNDAGWDQPSSPRALPLAPPPSPRERDYQGGADPREGGPVRTERNRVKLTYPYTHLRNPPSGSGSGQGGPESGPQWQPLMM